MRALGEDRPSSPLPSPRSLPFPSFRLSEMDFAKGLQKIVHNCRQSVMQEVGPRGAGQGPLEKG